jgi:uncharacterized membrane protein YcaP (DUF421 family)
MDSIIRAVVTFFFVWLMFRITGKRSFTSLTTFDFVLLLIISETTQEALTDQDHSMTNSFLLIMTFMGIELALSKLKSRSKRLERIMDGTPLILVEDGEMHRDRLAREEVDESDLMVFARESHGLERLDQIKFAVIEKNGGVSIIPKEQQGG